MTDFIDDLKEIAHDALGVRDDIGAIKDEVYIIIRVWDGDRIGDGNATETKARVLPSPLIVDLSHDVRISQAGAIKQGDLMLRQISMKAYPSESDINCVSTDKLIEKFYEIGGLLYKVIHVKKKYATWEIHVRKLTNQTRY